MSEVVGAGGALANASLPRGTVSLLFSDIEGSTDLLRELRGEYGRLLSDHAMLLRSAARVHGGCEVDTQGDAFFVVFPRAIDAAKAAVDVQRSMAAHPWPGGVRVRVRIGLHTGEPEVADERYVGLDVHRAARICTAAHGGQVLLSRATSALVGDELPEGVSLREVGLVRLKGFERPEALCQLEIAGLDATFPAPRGADDPGDGDAPSAVAIAGAAVVEAVVPEFELLLLGPVVVRRRGREVPITAAKHRMLLAALGLRVGETVSSDALIEALWADRPPATATKALQVYVSELRKLVEDEPSRPRVLTSQPPGYKLAVPREAVDLRRFERLWLAGREALESGDASQAARLLADALALWRGEPLADLRYEDGFAADMRRLDEVRVACLEDRIDADLQAGQHARLIPELEGLVGDFPVRERLCGQLMLALYRAGRQADALGAYQAARARLVDELGIDPSPALAALERRILQQDPGLAGPTESHPAAIDRPSTRTLVVVSQSSRDVESLAQLAAAITVAGDDREFVLARVVAKAPGRDPTPHLREVTRRLVERRAELAARGLKVRVAAFASANPALDLVKLADQQAADLLLVDATATLLEGRFGVTDFLVRDAACDVALHLPNTPAQAGAPLVVPFGGSEHDWAALELAALLSRAETRPLVLAGVDGTMTETGNDSSRLLATASLIIQRVADVIAEPVLVAPGAAGILGIADGGHIISGLSARFREEGLGQTRFQIARDAPGPVTFVRRGSRPGVLAPPESITRFTWSLAGR